MSFSISSVFLFSSSLCLSFSISDPLSSFISFLSSFSVCAYARRSSVSSFFLFVVDSTDVSLTCISIPEENLWLRHRLRRLFQHFCYKVVSNGFVISVVAVPIPSNVSIVPRKSKPLRLSEKKVGRTIIKLFLVKLLFRCQRPEPLFGPTTVFSLKPHSELLMQLHRNNGRQLNFYSTLRDFSECWWSHLSWN